jgi:hypothetical protein
MTQTAASSAQHALVANTLNDEDDSDEDKIPVSCILYLYSGWL